MVLKRIDSLEFDIISPEMARKLSVVEIKIPDTYDKDGYPIEGGLMDLHLGVINPGLRCKTCGQKMKECSGHFGNLELIRPVIHAEFTDKIEELLQSTCKECGRILLEDEKINELNKYLGNTKIELNKIILKKTKKEKRCPHCKALKEEITLDKPTNYYIGKERLFPNQIREWLEKIPNKDLLYFGYETKRVRPEWFVLTTLLVPPTNIRPSITLETGFKSEDDLTHKLVEIVRINQRLKENIEAGAPQLIIEDLWDLLQYHVTTYFDNDIVGVPPAKHRSGRPLKTIIQKLKGKKGRFRYNLIGKRVNLGARSTIGPDAFLSINEIGVPEYICKTLSIPIQVTKWNLKEVKKLIKEDKATYVLRPNKTRKKITETNKKELIEELDQGYTVERELENNDIILFNRQPTLHRLSMLAHKVKKIPGKLIRMNPTITKPYNADFDGDEMNIHIPQTEEGKTEALHLMLAEKHIISPRYGGPVIVGEEDTISGSFILTMKTTRISKEKAMKLLYEINKTKLPKPDLENNYYSGKLIFSQLLPKDLNIEFETKTCQALKSTGICKEACKKEKCAYDAYLKIKDGVIKTGVIDTAALGEVTGKLNNLMFKEYGSSVLREFYDKLNRIIMNVITSTGMSIGIDEYEITEKVKTKKEKLLNELKEKSKEIVKKYKTGKLELIPGKSTTESFETKMMELGSKIKKSMEKEIVQEKITEIIGKKAKYNTTLLILSGARGKMDNLTNLIGFYGQASVRGKRLNRGFTTRVISSNLPGEIGIKEKGFITSSLSEGINAKEYFYHAMGGRQGEVDTGVATKVSGYLYRRLANALKDLTVRNDLSVRTANNQLIQPIYGEDGLFPSNTFNGKLIKEEEIIWKLKKQGEKK